MMNNIKKITVNPIAIANVNTYIIAIPNACPKAAPIESAVGESPYRIERLTNQNNAEARKKTITKNNRHK
ncbi:MAG: hypothetical protein K9W44_09665 [Candidatus Lokiarchaeota archaeon]|nr:hypothetical protein [Candidatus Harpocratesius repetitus]